MASASASSLRSMLLEAQQRTFAEQGFRFSSGWFMYRNFIRGKTPKDLKDSLDFLTRLYKRAMDRSGGQPEAVKGGDSESQSPWYYFYPFLVGAVLLVVAGIALYFDVERDGDAGGEGEGGEGDDDDAVVWLFNDQVPEQFFVYNRASGGSNFVWFTRTNITFRLSESPTRRSSSGSHLLRLLGATPFAVGLLACGALASEGREALTGAAHVVVRRCCVKFQGVQNAADTEGNMVAVEIQPTLPSSVLDDPSGAITLSSKLWTADRAVGLLACAAIASDGCETRTGAADVVTRRCCVKLQGVRSAADAEQEQELKPISGSTFPSSVFEGIIACAGLLCRAPFVNKLPVRRETHGCEDYSNYTQASDELIGLRQMPTTPLLAAC